MISRDSEANIECVNADRNVANATLQHWRGEIRWAVLRQCACLTHELQNE